MTTWHDVEQEKYNYAYANEPCIPIFGDEKWKLWKKAFLPPAKNEKVLDVGCGPGMGVWEAKNDGYSAFGIDIASLGHIWEEIGVADCCSVAFADNIPFPDNEFGIVVCFGVLEHIPEEGIIPSLTEIKRVLKPHGLLCLSIGLIPYPIKVRGEELHITLKPKAWWKKQLTDLGFKIEEVPTLALPGNLSVVGTYTEGENL